MIIHHDQCSLTVLLFLCIGKGKGKGKAKKEKEKRKGLYYIYCDNIKRSLSHMLVVVGQEMCHYYLRTHTFSSTSDFYISG